MTDEATPAGLPDDEASREERPYAGAVTTRISARFSDTRLIRWLIPAALLFLGAVMLLLIVFALGVLIGYVPAQ